MSASHKPTLAAAEESMIAQKFIVASDSGSRGHRHPFLSRGALGYLQRTRSEVEGNRYSWTWTPHINDATRFDLADARFWARFYRSAFLRLAAPPTRTEGRAP